MTSPASACESRAFFVVDALSPGVLIWTRRALLRLGNLLSLGLKAPPPLGLAIMKRMGAKQSSQCNILLRPGPSFQLREYSAVVKRVTAANTDDAADGSMLAGAIKALLQHMMKLPGGEACHNHIFILSGKLSSSPKLQQVMQLVRQSNSCLHFLHLSGPEATAEPDALQLSQPTDADAQQQQQQQAVDTAALAAEFEQLVAPFAPHTTFDQFTADCAEVSDLLCQCWLRELMTSSTSKALAAPDLILHLGHQQQLPCNMHQHILQLEPWLLPAHLCPCHNQPMQPPTGSAVALQAAAAAATDPASAAGLLLLPEEVPWRCAVSGSLVLQALSGCRTDASMLQLSRHTQLKVGAPISAAAAAAAAAGGGFRGIAAEAIMGCSSNLPAALLLAPGQPCELSVKHTVSLSRIDSMMLYGMPQIVTPAACNSANSNTGAAAAAAAAASSAEDGSMFMRALCQVLLQKQQVLLASSHHDLIRRCQQPLQQWYMLQPAADGCSLLLRCMASKEQLLPPRGFQGTVQLEEEVVLLDAEQLEAARSVVAGLELGAVDAASAAHLQLQEPPLPAAPVPVAPAAPEGKDKGSVAAEAAGAYQVEEGQGIDAAAAAVAGVATAAMAHDADAEDGDGPLLVSCGLHEWLQTILDSSAATYQPPAAVAAMQQQKPGHTGPLMGAQPQQAAAAAVLASVAPATLAAAAAAAPAWQEAKQQQQQYPQQQRPMVTQRQGQEQQPMQQNTNIGPNQVPLAATGVTAQAAGRRGAGMQHGVTTAAQMLQGFQAGQQGSGADGGAVGAGASGRAQRRGAGRNVLRLSSSGAGGSKRAG